MVSWAETQGPMIDPVGFERALGTRQNPRLLGAGLGRLMGAPPTVLSRGPLAPASPVPVPAAARARGRPAQSQSRLRSPSQRLPTPVPPLPLPLARSAVSGAPPASRAAVADPVGPVVRRRPASSPSPAPTAVIASAVPTATAAAPARPDAGELVRGLERKDLDELARRLADPLERIQRAEAGLRRERGSRPFDIGH